MQFEIVMEPDDDGFVAFECPFCESTFGLNSDEYNDGRELYTELYCPYCGLNDDINNFYTKDVVKQAEEIALNYMNEEINKMFKKISQSKKSKFVKMTYKPLKNKKITPIKKKESAESIFECSNCNNHVKVENCISKEKIFCSYCGVDI